MIAFFEWPGAAPLPDKDHGVPVKGPVAFDHISIEVASDEDLWQLKARLEAADFWVSEVIDHGFIHSLYSFDPNSIPIEFSAPTPAVDLRSQPQMKDKHPLPVALEGTGPQPGKWPKPEMESTSAEERQVYPGEGTVFSNKGEEG